MPTEQTQIEPELEQTQIEPELEDVAEEFPESPGIEMPFEDDNQDIFADFKTN